MREREGRRREERGKKEGKEEGEREREEWEKRGGKGRGERGEKGRRGGEKEDRRGEEETRRHPNGQRKGRERSAEFPKFRAFFPVPLRFRFFVFHSWRVSSRGFVVADRGYGPRQIVRLERVSGVILCGLVCVCLFFCVLLLLLLCGVFECVCESVFW